MSVWKLITMNKQISKVKQWDLLQRCSVEVFNGQEMAQSNIATNTVQFPV